MTPKIHKVDPLYEGRVFTLYRETVTLSNGITVEMDIVRHPGATAIVALTANESVLMLRQYRHAVGATIWEIPAGTLNPGEDPIECAGRELVEETGYNAGKLEALGTLTPLPGYSDERIHLFLASELLPGRQKLDDDEVLQVEKIDFQTVLDMVFDGKIQDGKSISALLLAARRLGRI